MIADSKKRQKCVLSIFVVLFILVLGNLLDEFNIVDFVYLILTGIFATRYYYEVK